MPQESTSLSIVIITRNRPQLIGACLRQLLAQDYAPLDVIVVDASDGAETQQVMSGFPQVRYVHLENAAHQIPRSRNEGIACSRGEVIAFLDDDSLVQPGWARNLVVTYASAEIGGVGGLVLAPGEAPRAAGTLPTVTSTGSVLGDFNILTSGPVEVGHLKGCNMSFRRKALEAVGGFDVRLDASNYRDETDVCVGVRQAGFKLIYNPNVAVIHLYAAKDTFQREDWKDPKHRFSIAKNITYFRLKHFCSFRTMLAVFIGAPVLTLVNEVRWHGARGLAAAWSDLMGRIAGAWTFKHHGR